MSKSIFYHAGCPVCVSAEQDIVSLIGVEHVEVVHIGEEKSRIAEAENAGVKTASIELGAMVLFVLEFFIAELKPETVGLIRVYWFATDVGSQ